MNNNQLPYLAYMLRLWVVENAEQRVWRISLEEPSTQQQKYFDDLETLTIFLQSKMIALVGSEEDAKGSSAA